MQFRSVLPLAIIAGLCLVIAADECDKVAQCEDDYKNGGDRLDSLTYAIPNAADLPTMCQSWRHQFEYKACLDRVHLIKCHDRDVQDQTRLTISLIDNMCKNSRDLRKEKCAIDSESRTKMAKFVKADCDKQVSMWRNPVNNDPLKCMNSQRILSCIVSAADRYCEQPQNQFYRDVVRDFPRDCTAKLNTAGDLYDRIVSKV